MTPQQLRALRDWLPPFAEGAQPAPVMAEFCRYYGIDFPSRLPRVKHRVGYLNSGDYALAVHQWLQPGARANLLLVHGYFDHTGLFGKLAGWGLSRNCNVLVFDLPGHGLSSGEPAVIDDFAHYSRAIDDVLTAVPLPQLPLWVMAQSTGGAAVIDFAGRYDWPFDAAVLLAPLVRPAGWPWVRLGHTLLGRFIDSVPRDFAPNTSDREFLEFIRGDPLQCRHTSLRWVGALRRWLDRLTHRDLGVGPALVVQGNADGTVDWRYNVPVVEKLFPGSTVLRVEGAGHQLANESTALREDYLAQVGEYLAGRGIPLGDGGQS